MARKAVPKRTKHAVSLEQGGLCGCGCGQQLRPDCELEHTLPVGLEHSLMTLPKGINDPANLWWWNVICHKTKTRIDKGQMAKADAQGKKHRGDVTRKKGPKIQSRGFQGSRKFNGTVVFK